MTERLLTRTRPSHHPPTTQEATGLAATPSCTTCGAATPLADQFMTDEGPVCPACHLEQEAVEPPAHGPVRLLVYAVLVGILPAQMAWFAWGLMAAWLEGGLEIQLNSGMVGVVGAILAAMSVGYTLAGVGELRAALWGPSSAYESGRVRVFRGASGSWALLCSAVTAVCLAVLVASML